MKSNLEIRLSRKYKQFEVEYQGFLFELLVCSFGCLKEVKTMNMILEKCKFPNSFLPYFQYHML